MPENVPRPSLGKVSNTSAAPTPHSPPIAIPNSARRTRSAFSEGAKAQANSITEKPRMFEHQHRPAAVAVGQHAKKQSADGPKGLREKDRSQNRRGLGAELAGNRLDAKNQQKKVEAVERPAQKCGQKSMALRAGQLFKVVENRHWRENSRRALCSPPGATAGTEKLK